jgi:hypothetical protein
MLLKRATSLHHLAERFVTSGVGCVTVLARARSYARVRALILSSTAVAGFAPGPRNPRRSAFRISLPRNLTSARTYVASSPPPTRADAAH